MSSAVVAVNNLLIGSPVMSDLILLFNVNMVSIRGIQKPTRKTARFWTKSGQFDLQGDYKLLPETAN